MLNINCAREAEHKNNNNSNNKQRTSEQEQKCEAIKRKFASIYSKRLVKHCIVCVFWRLNEKRKGLNVHDLLYRSIYI